MSSTPYTGEGYFKVAVVNNAGDTSYWSNDGTSTGGNPPTVAVALDVSKGLFSVLLGDTSLGGMTQPVVAEVFDQPDRYLRVWFSTSASGPFSQLTPDTRIASVPYALQAQEAADADTVDGLHASQLETHYQNVLIVAKSGGDYTSVQAAINSISDATADNPYLVWVAPGMYSETVTMKPHVHLQGSGREATVITSDVSSSTFPPTEATLVLASDTSLRDLTVGNNGAGDYNIALLATAGVTRTLVADVTARSQGGGYTNYAIFLTGGGTGITLQQVSALAENGSTTNTGLINYIATTVLRGGSFTARGGTLTHGIHNSGSEATLVAENVSAVGENGSNSNRGLSNSGGMVNLHGGSFIGRGGAGASAISNGSGSAMMEAENVTALAENGDNANYGLNNYAQAEAILRGGSYTGRGGTDTYGIHNEGSDTTLEAESLTALGENGTSGNFGLSNEGGAVATLHGGSFAGRGGPTTRGIFNDGSDTILEAENVIALGFGTSSSCGLYNNDSASAMLRGGSFTGRGGIGSANGIINVGSTTTMFAEGLTALGENSINTYGLQNWGTADVTQSVLEGADYPVYRSSGSVTISNSRLVGGAAGGTVTCTAVSRGTTFNATGCP